MIDVCLLNPITEFEKEKNKDSFKDKKVTKLKKIYEDRREPPNGLMLLASYIEERGFSVEIVDCSIIEDPFEFLRKNVKNYRLLGVTGLTNTYSLSIQMAKLAKRYNPNLYIVTGGPHASFEYPSILRECPFIDVVFIGESEISFPWLVEKLLQVPMVEAMYGGFSDKLNALNNKPGRIQKILNSEKNLPDGIAYLKQAILDPFILGLKNVKPILDYCISYKQRNDAEFVDTGFPEAYNLENLPLPARHLIEMRYTVADVLINRGCPNQCSFCSRTKLFPKLRVRSLDSIFKEIEQIRSYSNYKFVNFYDNINVNHKFFNSFLKGLIDMDFNLPWGAEMRSDTLTLDEVKLMKQSNCKIVATGVESADREVLKRNFKFQNPEKVREGIRLIKSQNIAVQAYFMIGLPGDSHESFDKTLDFLRTLPLKRGVDTVNFFVTTLYPGCDLWANQEKYNLNVINHNKNLYNCTEIVFETPNLKISDIKKMIRKGKSIKNELGI